MTRLRDLDALEPGVRVRLRARVLECTAEGALLGDPSGRSTVRGAFDAFAGALVDLELTRLPGGIDARVLGVAARPLEALSPSGDVRRIASGVGAHLLARDVARRALRTFFEQRGSVEVETPTLVVNPGMDPHLDAYAVPEAGLHLSTSPEYGMKRLLAAGFDRIHQLGRAYRRDEAGALHAPEFTLCEWYSTALDADGMMAETEALALAVVTAVQGSARVTRAGRTLDFTPPWPRIPYAEALASADIDPSLPEDVIFERFAFELQPTLGRDRPCWVVDWPIALASLARPKPSAPHLAERFEAYAAGIEICNGFAELTDVREQRRRFEADRDVRRAMGKTVLPVDEEFLTALEDGMPDCAGNALGFDRLVLLATEAATIADVLALPLPRRAPPQR